MKLRLLLVDDEPLARLRLRKLLGDVAPQIAALEAIEIGEADGAAKALQQAALRPVDVVLLDIRMPGTDGLGLARQLRDAALGTHGQRPAVIFVTAHAEHALDAFEVEAVDYLTKPVRRERLLVALRRVVERGELRAPPRGALETDSPGHRDAHAAGEGVEPVLVIQDRGRVLRIAASEIIYLKAELKYVTVRTATASWVLDDSLAELESRLGRRFLRIHRNALVAVSAIRSLERRSSDDGAPGEHAENIGAPGAAGAASDIWSVQLRPTGEWLSVSRRQVAAVRACVERVGADP